MMPSPSSKRREKFGASGSETPQLRNTAGTVRDGAAYPAGKDRADNPEQSQ